MVLRLRSRNEMTQTVWKVYNGVDVVVEDNGEFSAEVSGVSLRHRVWESLRLLIEQEKKADAKATKLELECTVLIGDEDTGDYSVEKLTLVGLNRNDSSFKWSEGMDKSRVIYVLPTTQQNAYLLEQLAVAKSTVRDIEQAIRERLIHELKWGGRIEASKYNEQLQNLKDRYECALKGGK